MTQPGIYYPEKLTGEQLDNFLANGWYRMGRGIFTTHHIVYEEILYRVYWLRYEVDSLLPGKSWHNMIHRNRRFQICIKPLQVSNELEELYLLYKSGVDFDPAASIRQWLYENGDESVYDSYLVEIRDGARLIGGGIFDQGVNSIAGIMNFYDPAYKKYSLGKYLMLLKMEYARSEGIQWYYPGYIIDGFPKFDYKLFADKAAVEMYIPKWGGWCKYDTVLLEKISRGF
jgi:leucyl-tRNA---protein transferase